MNLENLQREIENSESEVDQDIIFEQRKVSTVIYKKISSKGIATKLFEIIKQLSKRIEDLEKEKLSVTISPSKLVKEETLEKIWKNNEDEFWEKF